MESAVTRIEPPEIESIAAYSQSQDGINLKSRIQLLELESAVGCSQL